MKNLLCIDEETIDAMIAEFTANSEKMSALNEWSFAADLKNVAYQLGILKAKMKSCKPVFRAGLDSAFAPSANEAAEQRWKEIIDEDYSKFVSNTKFEDL